MSDDQDSWLLNPSYNEDCSFPQFALLPWELRDQVWRYALRRRRIIRVDLHPTNPSDLNGQDSGDPEHFGRFVLCVNGPRLLSKLLRVNSQARHAALEFYRVRLPCLLVNPGVEPSNLVVGTLLFNPEYDVLQFGGMPGRSYWADLFTNIAKYDSRRIGLRNIAVSLTDIGGSLRNDDLDEYKSPAFIEAAKNIREVYLITETTSYHLENAKKLYNVPAPTGQPLHHPTPITQKFSPLMYNGSAFDLLHRDPRCVREDLARLFLGLDDIPKEISDWKLILREWGIDPSHVESSILFEYHDANPCLPSGDMLRNLSRHEALQSVYLKNFATHSLLSEPASSSTPAIRLTVEEQALELEKGERLAFGFWLFPLDAFNEATRLQHPNRHNLNVWDLSNYWPELGLFHIPTGPSSNDGNKTEMREA
ncbi:hypothetical protein F5Y19DRAFT_405723 [Xylariaceae sp. FL1651]|nr:hypothetical protein F5Y19DRAFT_405723 [Xylariaceae sp. FL1651]